MEIGKKGTIALAILMLYAMTVIVSAGTTWVGNVVQLATGSNTIGIVNQGTGSSSAWKVDGSAVTQPVSGTITASAPTSAAPTITKVTATTTSAQLLASNSSRKGISIKTDCANTDAVAINFGASAAVYVSHDQIPACASWEPPAGVIPTSAIQVIANSGSQGVRATEY